MNLSSESVEHRIHLVSSVFPLILLLHLLYVHLHKLNKFIKNADIIGPVFKEVDHIPIIFNQESLRPGLCVSTQLPNRAFDSSQTFKKFLFYRDIVNLGFPGGSGGKEFTCQCRMWVRSLGWEDPLEEGLATHSSILAWRIPWTEKPGRLLSIGPHRVGYD